MNTAQSLPDSGPTNNEILADKISRLAAHIHAATYRFLVMVREFDERKAWAEMGAFSCAHWLNWRCGISMRTAREKIRVAHKLAELENISAAFANGELSYSKVRALSRVANRDNEETLLNIAISGTAAQLERLVRCELRTEREAAIRSRTEAAYAGREFGWRTDTDGSVVFFGRLPAELAEHVIKAIEANLHNGSAEPSATATTAATEQDSPQAQRDEDNTVAADDVSSQRTAGGRDTDTSDKMSDCAATRPGCCDGSAEPRVEAQTDKGDYGCSGNHEGADARTGASNPEEDLAGSSNRCESDGSAEPRAGTQTGSADNGCSGKFDGAGARTGSSKAEEVNVGGSKRRDPDGSAVPRVDNQTGNADNGCSGKFDGAGARTGSSKAEEVNVGGSKRGDPDGSAEPGVDESGDTRPDEPATSLSARRADALVKLCQSACSGYEVTLHVAAGAALHANSLDKAGTLPLEAAERLCCDATIIPVTEDERGNVLNIGRKSRQIPPAMRRALDIRDKGCCRFPSCTHTHHLQGHHIKHWAHGGTTCLDNLVLLCWHHHRLVHEGGFSCRAVKRPEQKGVSLIFQRPDGVIIPAAFESSSVKDTLEEQHSGLHITASTCDARDGQTSLDVGVVIDALAFIKARQDRDEC